MTEDQEQPSAAPPVVIIFNAKNGVEARIHMEQLLGDRKVAPSVSDTSSDIYVATADKMFGSGPKTESDPTGAPTPAVSKPPRVGRKKVEPAPATEPVFPPGLPVKDETADQDAADEAADTAAAKAPAAPLTLDDARNAATPYINKFGKDAASKDLQPIVLEATGGKTDRISGIDPADQATIKLVIAAFEKAGAASERFVPKAKE